MLPAFESAVELQDDAVAADLDFGDLDQVADARRGSALLGDVDHFVLSYLPSALSSRFFFERGISTFALPYSAIRPRVISTRSSKVSFSARVKGVRRRRDQDGNGNGGSHTAPSNGGSVNGEGCRRAGAFQT